MRRFMWLFLPLSLVACPQQTVICTADEDCTEGFYCYLLPRTDQDEPAPEGADPHRSKYQDEGSCRQDCVTDLDCRGSSRCTERGLCRDLDRVSDNRQYTPAYEPDPVSLRNAFSKDRLDDCRDYMTCVLCPNYLTCMGGCPEVGDPGRFACIENCKPTRDECSANCEPNMDPVSRGQVQLILHCVDRSCTDSETGGGPALNLDGYVSCVRDDCPNVAAACRL